jgi:hypothetical protein
MAKHEQQSGEERQRQIQREQNTTEDVDDRETRDAQDEVLRREGSSSRLGRLRA